LDYVFEVGSQVLCGARDKDEAVDGSIAAHYYELKEKREDRQYELYMDQK
jgi:hypothetical protein